MSSALLVAFCRNKEKAQLVALLTQIALKGRLSGVILVSPQFASCWYYPECRESQLSTKILLGSAPAELARMVFPNVQPGARSYLGQFEGFVCVDGQLGREPGRAQVPLSEKLADVSKWGGFVTYYDTESKTCLDSLYKWAGRLLTQKGWKTFGVTSQGEPACRRVPDYGGNLKMGFLWNLRFREVLMVSYQDELKRKSWFLVLYKKMKNRKMEWWGKPMSYL